MNEKNQEMKNLLTVGIISSAKNNNIKGAELLFKKGAYMILNEKKDNLIYI